MSELSTSDPVQHQDSGGDRELSGDVALPRHLAQLYPQLSHREKEDLGYWIGEQELNGGDASLEKWPGWKIHL